MIAMVHSYYLVEKSEASVNYMDPPIIFVHPFFRAIQYIPFRAMSGKGFSFQANSFAWKFDRKCG